MRYVLAVSILLSSFGLAAPSAQASAQVDSELRSAAGRIRVIAVFKNRLRPVRNAQSASTYLKQRRFLAANAKESQKDFVEMIRSRSNLVQDIEFKSLWLVNAAIVDLPAEKISLLENHPDVAAIYANRKLSIIRDWSEKPLKLKSTMDADYTYGLNIINLPRLRTEEPRADGKGVLIGILDTGIDANHADVKGKVVGWKDFADEREQPYDDNGHGTHVAGTIAGGNASGQYIGVAPGAKLLIGKIFTAGGSATLDAILAGMQWIGDPDGKPETGDEPSLVSNSWGGGFADPKMDPAQDVLCKAVASWVDLGIFPVFAAGNSGPGAKTVGLPGGCPDAFAVGATDEKDAIARFSSRGPAVWKTGSFIKPNVSAPGVAVVSAWPGGGFKSLSGTSMATPHVAGLLGLVYQATPNLSIGDAADLVSRTTKDLGKAGNDDEFGQGRIDAFNATRAAQTSRARR